MSPGRVRAEDLTPAQRRELGVSSAAGPARGKGGGTVAGVLVCADRDCQAPLKGWAAVERHRDDTGHRRYELGSIPTPDDAGRSPA